MGRTTSVRVAQVARGAWPATGGIRHYGRALLRGALVGLDRVADTRFRRALGAARRVGRELAPDRAARLHYLVAALLLGTRRTRRPVRVRVRGPRGPRRFALPDFSVLLVLEEVFCDGEYDVPLPFSPRRILDLGSNVGASILFFALRYPQAAITGVEASPAMFRLLRENVGDLPGVTLHNAAVGATSRPVVFYEGVSSWAGSTQQTEWVHAERATSVPGITLDELLTAGAELVKMDIEGAEFEALPAARELAAVPAVLGEIHAPPGSAETERMLALFAGHDVRSTSPDAGSEQNSTVFSAIRALA